MKVSVITPSYNQGQFIERTLLSVANQRASLPVGTELQHWVFDGGSTDQTCTILANFSSPIQWVSEPDRGQTHAVNKGLQASDGEIIGWLNSDDIYYQNAIADVLEIFEKNPLIDVVYGMADHIDKDDQPFECYPSEPWHFERLKEVCFIAQPALFFRRRVLDQCGVLDESLAYCMDYEFWLRLAKQGVRFAYIEQKLAGSRLYAETKTLGNRTEVHREINDMLKKHFSVVPERWIINYAHAIVEPRYNRKEQPVRFGLQLLIESVRASYAWNGQCIPLLRKTFLPWYKSYFKTKLRRLTS